MLFHEPPYTEPYVRWCGVVWEDGELAVNSPPTRLVRPAWLGAPYIIRFHVGEVPEHSFEVCCDMIP